MPETASRQPGATHPPATDPRSWVTPVLWVLFGTLVLGILVPYVEGLILVIGALVASGIIVGLDAKALGLGRLQLARMDLTGYERMTPAEWGWLSGIFYVFSTPIYLAKRSTLAELARQAASTGQFATKKERNKARKSPGFATPDQTKARKKRSSKEGGLLILWILVFVALRVVSGAIALAVAG